MKTFFGCEAACSLSVPTNTNTSGRNRHNAFAQRKKQLNVEHLAELSRRPQ